jgi:ubiquinone/menaquinone biosynthesis C-methylase UbiE
MSRKHRVCQWWMGYLLASPIRRLSSPPSKLLGPYVRPGMTVLEPGPGMGFYTLDLARLVGPAGRVVAVDVQQRMLDGLRKRAARAGLLDRIDIRLAGSHSLAISGYDGRIDFTLAAAVVHEMPDAAGFFREAARASRPGGQLLFIEPRGHVTAKQFEAGLQAARAAGFAPVEGFQPGRSNFALLTKV